jgi:polyisoprenoid-binding protein YceI
MIAKLIAIMTVLLVLVAPVAAETKTFEIDPVHSSITFKIRHLYSTFTGRFNSFSGTISGDMANPETLKVVATVNVGSVDTANADRDKHLSADEIFNVKAFPSAQFESTKITVLDKKKGKVTGRFTLHGVTTDVTFEGEFLGVGPGPDGKARAGLSAKTTIDKTAFGIGFNYTLPNGLKVLGDKVELIINLEAIEAKPTPKEVTKVTEHPKQ